VKFQTNDTGNAQVAHFQWFYFRVAGAKQMPLVLHIVNAGESSFPEAWPGYQGCASYDLNPNGSGWFRVPTEYNESNGVLTFRLTPEKVGATTWDRGFEPAISLKVTI
jgi:hypothetical protein